MTVTDEQVAFLRAHLSGDTEEYQRKWELLDREAAKVSYPSLIAAAFFKAVDRHFDKEHTSAADVVEFVANVRARSALCLARKQAVTSMMEPWPMPSSLF
jgi:hypothetical protein